MLDSKKMAEFEEVVAPRGEFRLENVSVSVDSSLVRFSARLAGPEGADVWARAWISDENGTIAESIAPRSVAGDTVSIEVVCPPSTVDWAAYIRIESAPLVTEHVLKWNWAS